MRALVDRHRGRNLRIQHRDAADGDINQIKRCKPHLVHCEQILGDAIVMQLILQVCRNRADLQGESVDFLEDDQSKRCHGAPLKRGALGRIMT